MALRVKPSAAASGWGPAFPCVACSTMGASGDATTDAGSIGVLISLLTSAVTVGVEGGSLVVFEGTAETSFSFDLLASPKQRKKQV